MLKDVKVTAYEGINLSAGGDATSTALVTSMTLNGETATVVNGTATFAGPFVVAKDDDLKLSLSATFNGDFNSISSGQSANFAISQYKKKGGNENTYTTLTGVRESAAEGVSYLLDDYDTNELMYVRNTVPTIVATAGSSSSLTTSNNDIMNLAITADNADDVTIVTTSFNVITNVDEVDSDTMTIRVLNSSNVIVGETVVTGATATSTFNGTHDVQWTEKTTTGEVIPAGSTKNYKVRVNFGQPVGTDVMLSVELDESLTWWDEENVDELGEPLDISTEASLIDDLSGSFEIDNK
jgi:hypothetical protein